MKTCFKKTKARTPFIVIFIYYRKEGKKDISDSLVTQWHNEELEVGKFGTNTNFPQ